MNQEDLTRLEMIERMVAQKLTRLGDAKWLCKWIRENNKPPLVIQCEPREGPPPLFYTLSLPADVTLTQESVDKIIANWNERFDGKPPCTLIVLIPGCELAEIRTLDQLPKDDSAAVAEAVKREREDIARWLDERGLDGLASLVRHRT